MAIRNFDDLQSAVKLAIGECRTIDLQTEIFYGKDEMSLYVDVISDDRIGRMTVYVDGYIDIEVIDNHGNRIKFDHYEGGLYYEKIFEKLQSVMILSAGS